MTKRVRVRIIIERFDLVHLGEEILPWREQPFQCSTKVRSEQNVDEDIDRVAQIGHVVEEDVAVECKRAVVVVVTDVAAAFSLLVETEQTRVVRGKI